MSKQQNAVMAEIRRKELLELLNAEGHATVAMLCNHFKVSPATIRNDLNDLEAMRQLKRTHGGAISMQSLPELTSREKTGLHASAKRSIAQRAMDFVRPGQVIAIDTGTTTIEMARLLVNMQDVTVITNDLKIAFYLEENSSLNVILLGGMVRKNFHCTVGDSVLRQMDELNIDTLFLATNGMDIGCGLSTPGIETADVKRKMLSKACRSILLADSSKVGQKSLACFAAIDEIDILITDKDVNGEFASEIQSRGVEVIKA